jgi:hypothetical protein
MANHRTAVWRARVVTNATRVLRCPGAGLLLLAVGIFDAAAQPSNRPNAEFALRTDSILAFGGAFSKGDLGQSLNPFYPHESNYILGVAYARDFVNLDWGFVLGGEFGFAARFGNDRGSSEFWAGPALRHRGIPIGNLFVLSPALILGFSVATAPIGIETDRESAHSGSASLLFRFSPELAFRFKTWPNFEFVYRIHHRSGLYGVLGDLKEGSNAHVIGLRWYR